VSERLGVTPAEGRRSGQLHIRPAATAHQSKSLPALRSTKLNKVFTYGIVATREISIRSPWDGSGWWWRLPTARQLNASSASIEAGSGAPPAKPRAPAWASVLSDPFETVDLARVAAHRRGGELNTAARVSIFAGQNSSSNRHYIWGFLH
jgi:hypothetical protein